MKKLALAAALMLSSLSQAVHAGTIVVHAAFDHAYYLKIHGCNVYWQYSNYGLDNISYQGVDAMTSCLTPSASNIQFSAMSSAYPGARIDQVDLPSSYNNYTLTLLVVEPAGGSNSVQVRVDFNDNGAYYPPRPPAYPPYNPRPMPRPVPPPMRPRPPVYNPGNPTCRPGFNCPGDHDRRNNPHDPDRRRCRNPHYC